MKTSAVILAVALLAFGAGTADAQGSFWLGGNAGVSFPTGDYGDAAATGWNLGATGTYMVNDQWGWGADLDYHAWNASDDLQAATELLYGPGSEFKWSAFQATGHGMYRFATKGNVKPYAKVGAGLYNIGAKLESPSGDDSDSEGKFGFNFGGGMNFTTKGNMTWGVTAAYHIIPAEDDLGTDINNFTVGLNMMWGLGRH